MYCPNCGTETKGACTECGAGVKARETRFVRPRNQQMIGGICAGLAVHFGWNVDNVRKAMAILACVTVGGIVPVYLIAWAVVPKAQYAMPTPGRRVPIEHLSRISA